MSLYYDAAQILENSSGRGGSLRSRVYAAGDLRNAQTQVYALLAEATKWSTILKDVIERSGLLSQERKLTPVLALLLCHDLLLAKGGIAAHANHPLKLAVVRHKSRLNAELTRIRIKMGHSSLKAFKSYVDSTGTGCLASKGADVQPRWVRLNALAGCSSSALPATLDQYQKVEILEQVMTAGQLDQVIHLDKHIPDLVALPPNVDLSRSMDYRTGQLILQDKASCFPAYLLNPSPLKGDIIDTCAAPGNKTTHLAALMSLQQTSATGTCGRRLFAFERDKTRYKTLQSMLSKAGCASLVETRNTDFLSVDPLSHEFRNVTALLLDPSCSGTGIVGRDDDIAASLPALSIHSPDKTSRKRKRRDSGAPGDRQPRSSMDTEISAPVNEYDGQMQSRLDSLAKFQLKLLLHAMMFPEARRITYSTCSIHATENENVVLQALMSTVAVQRGWRVLTRHEQPDGLRTWPLRGDLVACTEYKRAHRKAVKATCGASSSTLGNYDLGHIADACIRCEKGTSDGTMGFFVAGFVRDAGEFVSGKGDRVDSSRSEDLDTLMMDTDSSDEMWEGFDD